MRGILILVFLFLAIGSWSQEDSTVVSDSIKPHSVRKATILSAVVPGAGQVYNHIAMPKGKKKAFWKVPLIYAGLGATTYLLINNQSTVMELRTEYRARENGGIGDLKWQSYDDAAILTLHDQYAKWRDFSIIGVAGVYLIQIADAAVEAHFVDFDISEDLSMTLQPTLLSFTTPGLRLSFNFHDSAKLHGRK